MYHLVTGACGFVGSSIVEKLVLQGYKVVSLDVKRDQRVEEISNFYQLDITDFTQLKKIRENISHIHHNAALVPLTKSGSKYFTVNTNGTKNMVNFACERGVKHLTHMSSSAIFSKKLSNQNIDITEYKPIDIYGRSKHLAELEIIKNLNLLRAKNITCSIIRPRTIIGEERLGIFSILFDWVKDDKKIPIIGNGQNLFQFAHISDIVDVSIETALRRKSGFYNIGTDVYGTLKNDLNSFFIEVGSKSKILTLNQNISKILLFILDKLNLSPLSPWHYLSYGNTYYYDLNKTFKELEWRPKYSNKEMLVASYLNFLKKKKSQDENVSVHKINTKQKFLKIIKFFL